MNRLDGNAHGDQAEKFALCRTNERQLSSFRRLAEWRTLGPILASAATGHELSVAKHSGTGRFMRSAV
jgi:hypothetical protein